MDAKTPVSWQSLFKQVEDPRARRHRLEDMLLIAVCACLGGADDVAGIAAFGQGHREWFERWLAWPHGIPARDTFMTKPKSTDGRRKDSGREVKKVQTRRSGLEFG